jgi:hypothetical protein
VPDRRSWWEGGKRYHLHSITGWPIDPETAFHSHGARKPTTTHYVFDSTFGEIVAEYREHRRYEARTQVTTLNLLDEAADLAAPEAKGVPW